MNRKTSPIYLLGAGIAVSFCVSLPVRASFLDNLFSSEEKQVLSAEQLSSQEGRANAMLQKAMSQHQSGKARQARDTYRSLVKTYPRSEAASEAQFQYARIREAEDEKKAFEAYEELITKYPNSSKFSEALERQYAIAEKLGASDNKGFLGIGAAVQPSKLIEMYQAISEAAPHSELAPKSLLSKGKVERKSGDKVAAVNSFQSVVSRYPNSPFATEAQYQIYEIRGVTAEDSFSPNQDRAQVEAGLDFVSQNPEDERAQSIRTDLQMIEERSIEKLFTTGKYYEEKMKKPDAAKVYYREVVKNPNTPYYAEAQQRLAALEAGGATVESRGNFLSQLPVGKKEKPEMRVSEDEVVPLPTN